MKTRKAKKINKQTFCTLEQIRAFKKKKKHRTEQQQQQTLPLQSLIAY